MRLRRITQRLEHFFLGRRIPEEEMELLKEPDRLGIDLGPPQNRETPGWRLLWWRVHWRAWGRWRERIERWRWVRRIRPDLAREPRLVFKNVELCIVGARTNGYDAWFGPARIADAAPWNLPWDAEIYWTPGDRRAIRAWRRGSRA